MKNQKMALCRVTLQDRQTSMYQHPS